MATAAEAFGRLTAGRYVEVDAGHYFHHHHPDAVVDAVDEVLTT